MGKGDVMSRDGDPPSTGLYLTVEKDGKTKGVEIPLDPYRGLDNPGVERLPSGWPVLKGDGDSQASS